MGENKVIDVINRLTSPDIIGTIFGCKRNGDPRSIFDIIKSVDKIAAKKKKKNKELYEALMNDKKTISQRDVEKFYKNKKKNGKKGKGKKNKEKNKKKNKKGDTSQEWLKRILG